MCLSMLFIPLCFILCIDTSYSMYYCIIIIIIYIRLELGEQDKHAIPCTARGWVCVPLVVEVFGGWGSEAQEALSRVAKELAIRTSRFWPEVLASIYCRLGITLMRQNARALLGRTTGVVDISSVYM